MKVSNFRIIVITFLTDLPDLLLVIIRYKLAKRRFSMNYIFSVGLKLVPTFYIFLLFMYWTTQMCFLFRMRPGLLVAAGFCWRPPMVARHGFVTKQLIILLQIFIQWSKLWPAALIFNLRNWWHFSHSTCQVWIVYFLLTSWVPPLSPPFCLVLINFYPFLTHTCQPSFFKLPCILILLSIMRKTV